jgi:hypothetical protein
MEVKHKGFTIAASAEYDEVSALWNGRYRILDSNGIVTYESFTASLSDESKSLEAADKEARAWIDSDPDKLSGSPE